MAKKLQIIKKYPIERIKEYVTKRRDSLGFGRNQREQSVFIFYSIYHDNDSMKTCLLFDGFIFDILQLEFVLIWCNSPKFKSSINVLSKVFFYTTIFIQQCGNYFAILQPFVVNNE